MPEFTQEQLKELQQQITHQEDAPRDLPRDLKELLVLLEQDRGEEKDRQLDLAPTPTPTPTPTSSSTPKLSPEADTRDRRIRALLRRLGLRNSEVNAVMKSNKTHQRNPNGAPVRVDQFMAMIQQAGMRVNLNGQSSGIAARSWKRAGPHPSQVAEASKVQGQGDAEEGEAQEEDPAFNPSPFRTKSGPSQV